MRILKLEFYDEEMDLNMEETARGGLRVSLSRGLEWFVQPYVVGEGIDEDYDPINSPASKWPMNEGGLHRVFGGVPVSTNGIKLMTASLFLIPRASYLRLLKYLSLKYFILSLNI